MATSTSAALAEIASRAIESALNGKLWRIAVCLRPSIVPLWNAPGLHPEPQAVSIGSDAGEAVEIGSQDGGSPCFQTAENIGMGMAEGVFKSGGDHRNGGSYGVQEWPAGRGFRAVVADLEDIGVGDGSVRQELRFDGPFQVTGQQKRTRSVTDAEDQRIVVADLRGGVVFGGSENLDARAGHFEGGRGAFFEGANSQKRGLREKLGRRIRAGPQFLGPEVGHHRRQSADVVLMRVSGYENIDAPDAAVP